MRSLSSCAQSQTLLGRAIVDASCATAGRALDLPSGAQSLTVPISADCVRVTQADPLPPATAEIAGDTKWLCGQLPVFDNGAGERGFWCRSVSMSDVDP